MVCVLLSFRGISSWFLWFRVISCDFDRYIVGTWLRFRVIWGVCLWGFAVFWTLLGNFVWISCDFEWATWCVRTFHYTELTMYSWCAAATARHYVGFQAFESRLSHLSWTAFTKHTNFGSSESRYHHQLSQRLQVYQTSSAIWYTPPYHTLSPSHHLLAPVLHCCV